MLFILCVYCLCYLQCLSLTISILLHYNYADIMLLCYYAITLLYCCYNAIVIAITMTITITSIFECSRHSLHSLDNPHVQLMTTHLTVSLVYL